MHEAFSRKGGAVVLAATGMLGATGVLGGCNTIIGLDDVSLAGSAGASSSGTTGSGGTTTASGGSGGATTTSGGSGGETTSSGGTTGSGGSGGETGGTTGSGGSGGGTTTSSSTGGAPCTGDADCTAPLVCDAPSGDCVQPTCGDAKKDGAETGPDCGGPMCPPCANGLGCLTATDCAGGVCASGTCQSPKCGDGIVNGADGCDDGNVVAGDGCSAACAVEPGWSCAGTAPSVCQIACGDGMVLGGEVCDDGNTVAGDGCTPGCLVETYHQCAGNPSVCVAQETRCQDGVDGDGDTLIDAMDPDCDLPVYMPDIGCGTTRVYHAVDVPLDVADNQQADTWSRIVVPESVGIAHSSVIVDIAHPRDSDVVVTLHPPFGQPRTLTNGNGGNGSGYVDTVLDGACLNSVSLGTAPFSNCYKPQSPLPGSGQQAQGEWWIQVQDKAPGQTGTLLDWTLVICGI